MKHLSLTGLLLASALTAGCAFENTTTLSTPTAPTGPSSIGGGASTGNASSNTTTSPASAFSGAWGSSSIAGLPLGNCADVKWVITAQTASSVSGTVAATCASGVSVTANLTGTMQNDSVIALAANGTLTAMGLPCQFNLNGTGTRQAGDTMKVDFNGTHCLGSVSGSETLRKFPSV
jgi:hypothetical protein